LVGVGSPDTILIAISTLVGVAGAMGVSYTVFRSAAEQRLREVDQHLIGNQTVLITQLEEQIVHLRQECDAEKRRSETYRESLTQKAAVEHLSEVVIREEQIRRQEHEAQLMLLKDMIAQMKRGRGEIQ
jgi:hypothetical protein